jgi:DnaJ-class molecular chaperone
MTQLCECPSCNGHGADPMSDNLNWLPCQRCHGKGTIQLDVPDMEPIDPDACPVCWGFGAGDDGDPCPRCKGTGCS